ncbi:MAG: hypothetical protein EHM33_34265 [Chloroflexi bacterium]|nr:MAG: hypothetical protein EHM33_34265 [Chloroflexota bacterium]
MPLLAHSFAGKPLATSVPQSFFDHYVSCALWSSTDDEGTPMDGGDLDLSTEAKDQMLDDCANFIAYCEDLELDWFPEGFEQSAHDFWLTRNGHGAGYWDRGLGDLGDKLTEAAKTFGSCDLYIGDDELIYCH